MKRTTLWMASLALSAAMFTGCAKEGCTDAAAINFNADAKNSDGSCQWDADVIFWFDSAFRTFMDDFGISEIRVFLGGDFIGAMVPDDYLTAQPDCSSSAGLLATHRISGVRTPNVMLRIEDQDGFLVEARPIGVAGGSCTAFRIN